MNAFLVQIFLSFLVAFCCTVSISAQEWEFSDTLEDLYKRATIINDNEEYLKAYLTMQDAQRLMDREMFDGKQDYTTIEDYDFENVYWPIRKSMAEIAYMLGYHVVMKKISDELYGVVQERYNLGLFNNDAMRDGFLADLKKIDAGVHYLAGEYIPAEGELKQALLWKSFDKNFVKTIHKELAQLYYADGRYEDALAQIDTIVILNKLDENLRLTKNKTNEKESDILRTQRAMCLAHLGKYEEAIKEMDNILKKHLLSRNDREYAEILRKKAKILMLKYDTTGEYDPKAKQYYQEYLSITKKYIDSHFIKMDEALREQYWMAEQPFVTDCYRLENKAPDFLYNVALFSKAILLQMGREFSSGMTENQRQKVLSSMRVTWKDVQRAMPISSTAIEFISYDKKEEKYYGALVLRKDSPYPLFVEIGKLSDILDFKLQAGAQVKDVITSTNNLSAIDALYNDSTLCSLIWNEDLIDAIGKNQLIYFAPEGIFHQIAIEYMLPKAISSRKCYRLTSTRLLIDKPHKVRTDKMLMCGGIDYLKESDSNAQSVENDQMAYFVMASKPTSLPSLPGTLSEIDSIKVIRSHHANDMVLKADSASETSVRELMEKYYILLISTHGYFAEVTNLGTDIRFVTSDTQLSQSCIFLSGAEKNMKNPSFDPRKPDGILSAREIASMNLSEVDLAVLSSCMSGLGYLTPDGVFGLQRGLKAAGVKAVIASLWEVDDQATDFMMRNLYANLENGETLYDAFNDARMTLKGIEIKRRRFGMVRNKSFDHPSLYDAFILIDGI